MLVRQFDIFLADLNVRMGTESGKTRPVVVIQTDLLNQVSHPSTIICPMTSDVNPQANILRVHLKKGSAGLEKDSDIMIDQLRAIDNDRLIQKIGHLPTSLIEKLKDNLRIVLDIES